jgi:tetratricopeptide (TPR) repeat protein
MLIVWRSSWRGHFGEYFMAKRKINTKFLKLLVVGVFAVAALGVGALKFKNRFFADHPEKYLAAGRLALEQKNYSVARDNLMHAAALSHPDAALSVMIGDALNGLSGKDVDNVAAARGMWEQALTIDPGNTAAMDRLIHLWKDEVELHPRPGERAQAAEQLQKAAAKLLAVDPDNQLAKVSSAQATIEAMVDGMQVNAAAANAAEDTLLKREAEDPADADIPFYAARGYVWQGQEAGRADDPEGQARLFATAQKVMSDALIDQPDNAAMHYRNGQILLQICSGALAGTQGSAPSDATKEKLSNAMAEIDKARELTSPDDPRYVEICLFDARFVLERPSYAPNAPMAGVNVPASGPANPGGTAETPMPNSIRASENQPERARVAESIYREVLAHRPSDPVTVLALADLLGNLPGRREEAMALLSRPLADEHPVPGIKGTLLPILQNEANMRLLSLQIDAAEAAKTAGKQQEILASADTLCDRVYGRSPNSPYVLGLKGRLELMHHRVVEATQTLKHALALTDPQDSQQQRSRYELMYNLARACQIAQQTGEAKKLANQIASVYPHFIPARMMLAKLLITEHDFAGAKPQIDYLESILPSHPELAVDVIRMRVVTLDPVRDALQVKAYYNRLPEATRDQRMDKAALARVVHFDDDAIRLDTLVHASSPGDAEAACNLAAWFGSHGQKQKAKEVLSQALAVNPADTNLLAAQMQIDGKTSTADQAARGGAGGAPGPADAFNAEVAQVEVARSHGDMASVDLHLAAAEKLKPDEPFIWDALFQRAIETSQWDRAAAYVEKLAAANVDHAGGLIYRVRYALARSDTQKAQELALQLTQEKPEFSVSWSILGQVQKAQGNYEDAITSFQQALERQVQNLEAIRGIVDCSYAMGNVEQAKRYIDIGRRIAPSSAAFKELGLSYELTYGDPQNVIAPRLEAMQASPDDPQAWLNLANAYAAASQSRAKAQDAAAAADYSQKDKALLQQAIAKFPNDERFGVYLSKLDIQGGDFAAAERVMLDLASQPSRKGRPQTAVLLSDFYADTGKSDRALKILTDYLATPSQPSDHSGDVVVELRLSSLLAKLNRFDDAIAALSANAQDPAVARQKIGVLIDAGRDADAIRSLNAMAAVAPLTPDLLSLKGVASMNAGSLTEARECFDQVIAAQPNNTYALTERARVTMRNIPPNYGSAIADLDRARDLAPQEMETRFLIVDADRRRNQPDDAIREMESAIRVAPANKRVRLTLIDLYASAVPPRWADVERVIRQTKQIPSLAGDADFVHEEAVMDLGQGEFSKAEELIRTAMQQEPGNMGMVHTYYDVLLRTRSFEELLANTAQLLAAQSNGTALWWVYPYRAQALARGQDDKAGAAVELGRGLDAASAEHDAAGAAQIIQTYAELLGTQAALKVAADRAENDPHWLLLAAALCRQKGDADGAIHWLELAIDQQAKLSTADQNEALRMAASEYLAKTPPDTLKSAETYRQIIKRSPDDIDSLNNLACILVEPGPAYQPREALDCSERAYNLMVRAGLDEPLIKDTYGWTLIANGRDEEGLTLVQDALGKRDFAEGHYHLAEGLLKRQPPSVDDAASELVKAMQMLDQAERDGKPVDDVLKLHVQDELKRTRSGLAG